MEEGSEELEINSQEKGSSIASEKIVRNGKGNSQAKKSKKQISKDRGVAQEKSKAQAPKGTRKKVPLRKQEPDTPKS